MPVLLLLVIPPLLALTCFAACGAVVFWHQSRCIPTAAPTPTARLQLVGAGLSQPACATVHAPLALLPVPYPRDTFLQAKQAALAFNSMVDAVSRDEAYLQIVLAAAAQEDEFTVGGWVLMSCAGGTCVNSGRMLFGIELGDLCRIYTSVVLLPALSCCHSWTPLLCSACPLPPPQLVQAKLLEVFQETAAARHAQQAAGQERVLAVLRSDYMLHTPTNSLLQVELNTIASSFGCLSTLVGRMHRYLLGRLGASEAELAALPEHNTMDAIADAMGAAAAEYGVPGAVMVMVVQPGERNAYDQQWLQTRLWERHGVRTLRRSLAQVRGVVWVWVRFGQRWFRGCLQHWLAATSSSSGLPCSFQPCVLPQLPAHLPPAMPCSRAACGRGAAGCRRPAAGGGPPGGCSLLPCRLHT